MSMRKPDELGSVTVSAWDLNLILPHVKVTGGPVPDNAVDRLQWEVNRAFENNGDPLCNECGWEKSHIRHNDEYLYNFHAWKPTTPKGDVMSTDQSGEKGPFSWSIEQRPQRQDSLEEQVLDLHIAAARLGMYDAADWLWKQIQAAGIGRGGA